MTEKKAVVFGVKCAGCGRMRYLKARPPAGPYRCAACRQPAVAPTPAVESAPPRPRDPFYTDDARRAELAARDGRRPWIPARRDWLRR